MLRAQGDKLANSTVLNKTYARNINVPPEELRGHSVVPDSDVSSYGMPNAVGNPAAIRAGARVLLG